MFHITQESFVIFLATSEWKPVPELHQCTQPRSTVQSQCKTFPSIFHSTSVLSLNKSLWRVKRAKKKRAPFLSASTSLPSQPLTIDCNVPSLVATSNGFHMTPVPQPRHKRGPPHQTWQPLAFMMGGQGRGGTVGGRGGGCIRHAAVPCLPSCDCECRVWPLLSSPVADSGCIYSDKRLSLLSSLCVPTSLLS